MLRFVPFLGVLSLVVINSPFGLAAERPTAVAGKSGRSVTMAPHGMIATSHPLAAQIGLDVLKRGGNAVDAAIATSAAMGVLEPMSCGIGGDLYAIVYDAKTQKLYGLNASGRAPGKATRQLFADRKLTEIPETGPLSWSVPGCVDGWDELRKRFGSKPFAELLEPSIGYAADGAPVPEVIAGYWKAGERGLRAGQGTAAVYLPGPKGQAPKAGEVFKNPALAATYQLIAKDGRDAYYKGPIADRIVAFSDRVGGLFAKPDFATHTSTWVDPAKTTYRGHEVWEIPPPGQGIAALQMLNLLEPYDLKAMGPNSPDYWHLFTEAKKLAYADRARFYADPAFAKAPVDELISKEYAAERRKRIDPHHAARDVPAGDPKIGRADTIYLCVVDKNHNCVSLIQSNYYGFGSMCAVPELGFALQNRGSLFALDEAHANRLEPGKRPFHTIIPAMVTQAGKPRFVFGVMGGDMQPQGQVEVLVNLLDFGMDVQAAGEAPRIEHIGSATPTGRPARGVGTIQAEGGIPEAVVEELTKRGHQVRRVARNGGGYQGIWIDPATGTLRGGTEARKDGAAVGY
ncbi:gamma-glutamyltransferase [Fimbriiglobus ruber]|uniref:Glutathione hydrolase proenzyme n=1 Tax=Fimbriiglobus ruber TaxID=1908690 RepID=A0A225D414_9BACT|nr:gamma-glutamyltransferase [Fimbriiglobus ruber]OWK36242.1 Gamma-glutamyltranspeptidase [Fimbriiglobus ruber]